MKVVAFVAEYNPFHHGHKYHLEKSLSSTGASHSIAIISSSFLQRGEPSLVDKWTRAKMAIENGVDLVLELPFIFSCQSAELFASGSINILNSLNVVDYLSFASEIGDLEPLLIISKVLLEEPSYYKKLLQLNLSKGLSFPTSRSMALEAFLTKKQIYLKPFIKKTLRQSNNILAIEYLKALSKVNSSIKPLTFKRIGSSYKETKINNRIASATGIRKLIFNNDLTAAKKYVSKETYQLLDDYKMRFKNFNSLANYSSIIKYILIMDSKRKKIKRLFDFEPGLENRISEKASLYNNIEDIVNAISTKRYPITRVQRILIHLLNSLYRDNFIRLFKCSPQYIRVLGFNHKGADLLSHIKNNSNLQIITKFANYKRANNPLINSFLSYEEKATDLYFLGVNLDGKATKMDYLTPPYIK